MTGPIKSTLLISFTAVSVACGGGQSRSNTTASPPSATKNPVEAPRGAAPSGNLTLIGCLQRPSSAGATGTAGSAVGEQVQARPSGDDARGNTTQTPAPERYLLSNATVESRAGGPLLGNGTSFELDRLPAGAQVSPNTRVRVTGEIDQQPTGAAGAGTNSNAREDTKANSLTVAGDSSTRRFRVETIQTVAQDCSSSR